MPAAVRGGSRSQARPPTKAPPKATRRAAARAANAPAGHPGLSTRWTLISAAAVLVLTMAGVLASGHRGERLVAAVGAGIDGQFGNAGFRLKSVACCCTKVPNLRFAAVC